MNATNYMNMKTQVAQNIASMTPFQQTMAANRARTARKGRGTQWANWSPLARMQGMAAMKACGMTG